MSVDEEDEEGKEQAIDVSICEYYHLRTVYDELLCWQLTVGSPVKKVRTEAESSKVRDRVLYST